MDSMHRINVGFPRFAAVFAAGWLMLHQSAFAQRQDEYWDQALRVADERAAWYHSDDPVSAQVVEVPPPEPEAEVEPELPPLDLELDYHGGSYLYEPTYLATRQLPHGYSVPRPVTAFQEFLGADPIAPPPNSNGVDFAKERQFVGYGSYSLIGIGFDGNNPSVPRPQQRISGIGHQLIVDLDYRVSGTERAHVQFRPLGRENSGGSLLLLDERIEYDDNSTLIPDRFWFEGEVFSVFGDVFSNEFVPRDYHFVVGKFPFVLHNALLVNEELLGVAINKNTLIIPPLSNMNIQLFYGYDDGEAFEIPEANLTGVHVSADYRHVFIELTLAGSFSESESRQAVYSAASITRLWGPLTLAGRALGRWADSGPHQAGGLFVVESNWTRQLCGPLAESTGLETAVTYATAFYANEGWRSMAGGNFDRLRSAFAVNPLVALGRLPDPAERYGVALGTQLFRDHEDTSIIPEIAFEEIDGTPRVGIGGTYLRQLGRRTFLDLRGIATWSDDTAHRQQGIFSSVFFVF